MSQSVFDIESRRLKFVMDLKDIDSQLGQTRRNHPGGREMTRVEYSQWRNKALAARKYIERGLLQANLDLKRARAAATNAAAGASDGSPDALLLSAYTLLRRLADEGVDLDPDEFAVMDAVRAHLQRAGKMS